MLSTTRGPCALRVKPKQCVPSLSHQTRLPRYASRIASSIPDPSAPANAVDTAANATADAGGFEMPSFSISGDFQLPSFSISGGKLPQIDLPTIDMASLQGFLPKIDMDSLPQFTMPSLPQIDMPSLPQIDMPSLPSFDLPFDLPSFELPFDLPSLPSLPSFELPFDLPSMPSLPSFELPSMPSMPSFDMPSMPNIGMPSMPSFDMPSMPSFEMPSMPTIDGIATSIESLPTPNFSMPTMPSIEGIDASMSTSLGDAEEDFISVATGVSIQGWIGIALGTYLLFQAVQVRNMEKKAPLPPRKDCVLVLGATGRVGRLVVKKLIERGRNVVALTRSAAKSADVFRSIGVEIGFQKRDGHGVLYLETNNEMTRKEVLTENDSLWKGVTQVISLIGPNSDSPEGLEARFGLALVEALKKYLPNKKRARLEDDIKFGALEGWENLDDINVGGKSTSSMRKVSTTPSGIGAIFSGEVVAEGGGFVGVRSPRVEYDFTGSDGLHLVVRGDGKSYKLNVKTVDQLALKTAMYQTTFDTFPAGEWIDVYLPWHNFVRIKDTAAIKAPPLNPKKVAKIGLSLSRFDFNGRANPLFTPGKFRLEFDGTIESYRDPRPQVIMISSVGVERSAVYGEKEECMELRENDPNPLVRTNPANTLNYKFFAEGALRSSGYPYTVIRLTTLVEEALVGPYLLESGQGDEMNGVIGRDEAADVVVNALEFPESVDKTLEVRRSEATDGKRRPMVRRDWLRFFMKIKPDRIRMRFGIDPQPRMPDPPIALAYNKRQELEVELARVSSLRERSLATIAEAEAKKKAEEVALAKEAAAKKSWWGSRDEAQKS